MSFALALAIAGPALAQECDNPNALGTARTVAVDPVTFGRVGFMQYRDMIELQPKEVILTFDDGPLPPMTTSVLDTLKRECVKATFFIVGRMARAYPAVLRRTAAEGHTIATHSQTHPIIFPKLSFERGRKEIDDGFASINAVLAEDGRTAAPWFRFPGLGRTAAFEAYLASQRISVMSADFPVDDWLHLKADEVFARALSRLEERGRGMMLLHDIQPSTATMLPRLLRVLKERGYRIVQIVPTGTPGVPVAALESRTPRATPTATAPQRPPRATPAAAGPAAPAPPRAIPAAAPPAPPPVMDRPPTQPMPPQPRPAADGATGSVPAAGTAQRPPTAPLVPYDMPFVVRYPSSGGPQELRGAVP